MRKTVTVAPDLDIAPRSEWADSAPTGPLEAEAAGDVRFLLVHHTASSNDYSVDDVPRLLRSFYAYHTGPEKGWPDIAYNFMVDRFGGVWEAREGSLDAPIKGSATGGSQGFALLCCLVGNHDQAPPTAEAVASLSRLLGWLAQRYEVALGPDETVNFTSRGSSRWPEGATVTAASISAHREMSSTTCPGDYAFNLIQAEIVPAARLAAGQGPVPDPTTTAPPTTEAPTTVPPTTVPPTTEASTTEVPTTASPATASPTTSSAGETAAAGEATAVTGAAQSSTRPLAMIGVAVLGAVGGLIALRRRVTGQQNPKHQ